MRELIERIKSDTPTFWKKVRNTAIVVGAGAGLLLSLPVTLPVATAGLLTNVVIVCTTIAGTSQLTKTDKDDEKL